MHNILITGANGYMGQQLIKRLLPLQGLVFDKIVGLDIRFSEHLLEEKQLVCLQKDIRSKELGAILLENNIDTVVHLAAIISTPDKSDREREYDIDVNGTRNLVDACIEAGVKKFITTSSGAAYGYHPENVHRWLTESDPIRGNYEFTYSHHKRLVEELLAEKRTSHPQLAQFVFRVGTILGKTTKNPITEYLEKPKVLELKGYPSPFVFIWDQDLAEILLKAATNGKPGIYNVAGDGCLTVKEVAAMMGKKNQTIPGWLVKAVFGALHPLKLSKYDAFIVNFIQYRPVLSNEKLKKEFGYIPQKTSKEVFQYYLQENIYRSVAAENGGH